VPCGSGATFAFSGAKGTSHLYPREADGVDVPADRVGAQEKFPVVRHPLNLSRISVPTTAHLVAVQFGEVEEKTITKKGRKIYFIPAWKFAKDLVRNHSIN
jgi:hypothetical protein